MTSTSTTTLSSIPSRFTDDDTVRMGRVALTAAQLDLPKLHVRHLAIACSSLADRTLNDREIAQVDDLVRLAMIGAGR